MDAEDFWNLAGRAGRWGKEFTGEIYCIDADDKNIWKDGAPPSMRSAIRIKSSLQIALSQIEQLIEYISAGAPPDFSNRTVLEGALSYLVDKKLQTGASVGSLAVDANPDQCMVLDAAIDALIGTVQPYTTIINRNPGISPLAIVRFSDYLQSREDDDAELIPPDIASDNANLAFTKIFGRIHRELGATKLGPGKQSFKAALLVVGWMRGYPVPRLIDDRARALKAKENPKQIATVIRDVLREIDEIARYQAPKYLSCYIDLVTMHLRNRGKLELISRLENYAVLLELGVSTQTQLSLMSLGLSRTAAAELFQRMARDNMTADECLRWLRMENWRQFVPRLVTAEIEKALSARATS